MIVRLLTVALALAASTAVSSAQSNPPKDLVRSRTMPPTYSETAPDYALQRFDRPSARTDEAYAFMANRTRLVSSAGAPIQVVYSSAEGAIALWFPDRGTVMRGRWYIEERRWELLRGGVAVKTLVQPNICFDYSGGVPKIVGPEWQRTPGCSQLENVRNRSIDHRSGDIFGLSNGTARRPLGTVNPRKLDDLK